MRVLVGTSGYSYKEWRGTFYPPKMAPEAMLAFYAGRFPTVEINNTFYRLPTRDVLVHWAEQVPESFTFVLKASQRITHRSRLEDVEAVAYFFQTAAALGPRLGPVLFQLPPQQKADLGRLRRLLAEVPAGARAAFEFRHPSWFDQGVYDALREHGAALCTADTDDEDAVEGAPGIVSTAGWGYLRLRRADYTPAALAAWRARVLAQPWSDAYVFFKHEDEARGPDFAEKFAAGGGA
jgi:uncharacterized protein YecE (DUF72 family)